MLVFFIHGVATRDVQYAETLQQRIRDDFRQRGERLPYFYASFWGNVLKDISQMWNCIEQDLQILKQAQPEVDTNEFFRYQRFREEVLSSFVGDFFTYFNSDRGLQIRKLISQQLKEFILNHSQETEIHFVAHSLGTVILWDMLFSDRFEANDPAFQFRSLIQGLSSSQYPKAVRLKSITTMGSPIAFVNTMLGVKHKTLQDFAQTYTQQPIQWVNLIHPSDIIAYPLKTSLNLYSDGGLQLRDEYITEDKNLLEKFFRSTSYNLDNLGKNFRSINSELTDYTAMALGARDAHLLYWQSETTAQLILDHLHESDSDSSFRTIAITRLKQVPGMTLAQSSLIKKSGLDTSIYKLKFTDKSGSLHFFKNPLQVHFVQISDEQNQKIFTGYVGLIHGSGLTKEVEFIKTNFTTVQ